MNTIRKLCLLFMTSIILLMSSISVKVDDYQKNNKIQIEIKGNVENPGVFEIEKGSRLSEIIEQIDIKEDSDLSKISLNDVLYHNQIIVIPTKKEQTLVSINSADIQQLCSLPGIGIATAENIIKYRNDVGSFNTLEDLMNVKGIGYGKYNKIKELICL